MRSALAVAAASVLALVLACGPAQRTNDSTSPSSASTRPRPSSDEEQLRTGAFRASLEGDGFNVEEGFATIADPPDAVDAHVMDSAAGFNYPQYYKRFVVPAHPALGGGLDVNAVGFRLAEDEAIVYLGPTPPHGDYFSFCPMVWARSPDVSGAYLVDWIFSLFARPHGATGPSRPRPSSCPGCRRAWNDSAPRFSREPMPPRHRRRARWGRSAGSATQGRCWKPKAIHRPGLPRVRGRGELGHALFQICRDENGTPADFTLGNDDMVVAYGVNHAAVGVATYSNVIVYGDWVLYPCPAPGSEPQYLYGCGHPIWNGVVSMNSHAFTGSAEEYIPGDPMAPYLYAVRVMRAARAVGRDRYRVVVPEPTPSPYYPGELSANGIPLDRPAMIGYRAYLNPVTGSGPRHEDLIPDRAIWFRLR